jgi:hypothetical protein
MPIPQAAADYLDWWRSSVAQGNALEATIHYNNVVAHSRNILAHIVSTPTIDAALGRAIKASQGYFLAQRDITAQPSNGEALAALDALAEALDHAKPSDMAKALGLG